MDDLWELFVNHDGRPIHKLRHYFPVYERHFARFVGQPATFIEIGCGYGGSAQMWARYLGERATIVGIDIREEARSFEEGPVRIRIGDQADADFLHSVVDEFGPPDAVLDDGSHQMSDVTATFCHLYPQMAVDGVYMVEDAHTAYWRRYGGGLRRKGTFIEQAKLLVDELNAYRVRRGLSPTAFTESTTSIHFYPSMIVFERGHNMPPEKARIGKGRRLVRQRGNLEP